MIESKRLFLAIKIIASDKFINTICELKQHLKHENIRWIKTENLHLTLRFLGDTSFDEIQGIIDAITKAIENVKPFNIEILKLGVFGSSYHPKVIWFQIKDDDVLKNMERKISSELDIVGFRRDRQNFVPHLTIARMKSLTDKNLFKEIIKNYKDKIIQESEVQEVILYESILKRTGAIYKVIQKFDLKA